MKITEILTAIAFTIKATGLGLFNCSYLQVFTPMLVVYLLYFLVVFVDLIIES